MQQPSWTRAPVRSQSAFIAPQATIRLGSVPYDPYLTQQAMLLSPIMDLSLDPRRTTRDQGLYLSHSRSALGGTRVTVPPPPAATTILVQLALALTEPAIAQRLCAAPFTSVMPLRPDTTVQALTHCPVFGRTFGCYYCCILICSVYLFCHCIPFFTVALLL